MNSFEKLLDTVRKENPNLISEQAAEEMLSNYNDYETQLKDAAFADGKAAGFNEGYYEGVEKQKAVCKQEMDDLLAKCDEDATTKLEAIIKSLNEAHADKLQQVYDICSNNMVPVKDVQAMDEDHAKKFNDAIEGISQAHTDKMIAACEAVEKKYKKIISESKAAADKKFNNFVNDATKKLEKVGKILTEERARKLSTLSESVEKYLNYALQSAIPTKKIVSEAKYNASQKAIEKITSILKINNILQESKDGIFQDYENKLKSSKNEQNKLIMENSNLRAELGKKEAKLLLESKISKCTPAEGAFLRSYFENAKSPKVIEEQIEDARSAYDRLRTEKRAAAVSKVKSGATASAIVNENKEKEAAKKAKAEKESSQKKIVAESKNEKQPTLKKYDESSINTFMNAYSEMLKRS